MFLFFFVKSVLCFKGNCCDFNVQGNSNKIEIRQDSSEQEKNPQLNVHADLQHNVESFSRENPKIEATDTQNSST